MHDSSRPCSYGPSSRRHVEEIRQRKEREDLVAKLVQGRKSKGLRRKKASSHNLAAQAQAQAQPVCQAMIFFFGWDFWSALVWPFV
jgi:hypothetical protein